MKLIEQAREGLFNLYFSKLRSILAVLGVLVGTASVVAMVLGGELATNEALKQFKSLGTDLLSVSINSSRDEKTESAGKTQDLTLSQALSLQPIDPAIKALAPYTLAFSASFYNGTSINAMILGVTDGFADIVRIQLDKGRFVSLMDQYRFYCVIGHQVYERIKAVSLKDPIGEPLQIGKHIFMIVGVAKPWPENGFIYANIDNSILIPLLASSAISKYASINNIIFRLAKEADISRIENKLSTALGGFLAGKQFNYRSAKELIAKMRKQNDILTIFLGLIGSISLIVGGIGVMNIMLVSVVERRREIGIRLAVGATRLDISTLFLMEAVMLSLAGGVLGVAIGILIAYVIAWFSHWTFTLFLWPPLAGFSVSVLVGIFFGFYPAYLASKLDPIEALRSD